jgi:hypothetical protein
MSNPAKQKGTSFETLIVNLLKVRGFPRAYRPALTGTGDVGDINGVGKVDRYGVFRHVVFQCKNQKTFKLGSWMNDTKEQAERKKEAASIAQPAVPVLVVKRPGYGSATAGKNYAIMELEDMVSLLQEAGYS